MERFIKSVRRLSKQHYISGGGSAVNYDVIALAANSSLRALRGTDWAGPIASRSLVLKMKKLLDDSLDLM